MVCLPATPETRQVPNVALRSPHLFVGLSGSALPPPWRRLATVHAAHWEMVGMWAPPTAVSRSNPSLGCGVKMKQGTEEPGPLEWQMVPVWNRLPLCTCCPFVPRALGGRQAIPNGLSAAALFGRRLAARAAADATGSRSRLGLGGDKNKILGGGGRARNPFSNPLPPLAEALRTGCQKRHLLSHTPFPRGGSLGLPIECLSQPF